MPFIVESADLITDTSSTRPVKLGALDFTLPTPEGVDFIVTDVPGWDNGAASTLQTIQRLRAPGGWRSSDPQFTVKPIGLEINMEGPNLASLLAAVKRIRQAATLDETTLTLTDPGVGSVSMGVSRQGEVLATVLETYGTVSVSLTAADPRKFGPILTGSTPPPSSTGGLAVPFTVPFSIDATVETGQITLTNPGDLTGPVVARVDGPCTGFTITHTGVSGTRIFSMNLSLAAGEWVVVDMENETVLAQGQSSRTQWVTSRGFAGFDPGVNGWAFAASGATSATTLTITATPTYE